MTSPDRFTRTDGVCMGMSEIIEADHVRCDTETEGLYECDLIRHKSPETRTVEVEVVTFDDMDRFDHVKLSRDPYDMARDQEFQVDSRGMRCNLHENPKGRPALSCVNDR